MKKKETLYKTYFTKPTTAEGIEEAIRTLKLAEETIKTEIKEINSVFDAEMEKKGLKIRELVQVKEVFPREPREEVHINFNLDYPITKIVVLRKVAYDFKEEKILIERANGERKIIHRHANKYGVSAACSPRGIGEIPAYLIVRVLYESVLEKENSLLDRGICWIHMGNPGYVTFNLVNVDKHLSHGEIARMLKKVEKRVDRVLDKISNQSQ